MHEFRDVPGAKMSTGMKQKVSIARSVIHDPPVMVFDEPTTGLDVMSSRTIVDFIRRCRADGKCVIFSTHIMSEVETVAERVGIIRQGRLIAVESVAGLRSKAIRTVNLFFDEKVDAEVFRPLPGVREVTVTDHHVTLSFDGQMETLLKVVTSRYSLLDITTHEADLEEIFLTYYRDEEAKA